MRPTLTLVAPMRDIPVGLKPRLRELSLGPWEFWGFWGWTHHDGSTWAALGFDGDTTKPERLIGWAALTMQVDVIPVVGCYVAEGARRGGRGELLLVTLLRTLTRQGVLTPGVTIAAATQRWAQYPEIIQSCGLRCVTWGTEEK
jgi:hypothetical protein